MKIGIIGLGNIGGTLTSLFAKAGHEVFISNSRGPQSLKDLVNAIGSRAKAVSPEEAVALGDVIVLALPWRNRNQLPAAQHFDGKIVIDATNPYKPDLSIYDLGDSSSSEEIAKLMPRARLVKACDTPVDSGPLREGGRKQQPHSPIYNKPLVADEPFKRLATV